MRRPLVLLAALLALTAGNLLGVAAQVETPVAELPATPLASPAARPAASPTPDLTGVAPLPLTGERRAEFEAYVADMVAKTGVPGAAVAVVQGGEVVYLNGFGVREVGRPEPVTPDTLMRIGSVTKAMTGVMAATLVDDGRLSWETPVVDLLPTFAVADPALTPRLTVRDAFCACTGLVRRDLEIILTSRELSTEGLVASVRDLPLTAPYGERFQYNNQMYAAGGYAAAVAAGGAWGDLSHAYALAMQERLLNPIGMPRSTLSVEQVLASGDYAGSHDLTLAGEHRPLPLLEEETFVSAVAPAGALWSSAREMARFVQTQLAEGVAPDGGRVVSAENLAVTWEPQVAIPPDPSQPSVFMESAQAYGQGWVIGAYKGQRLLSHSGGTAGFASQVAVLPEADLGLVVLTNGRGGRFLGIAAQFRLLELAFGQAAEFEALAESFLAASAQQRADILATLAAVDPAAVAPYLGRYAHPALGEVGVALRGDRLLFDAGEVRWELRPVAGEEATYVFYDGPAAGLVPMTFQEGEGGRFVMVLRMPDEAATTYAFEPIAAAGTPSAGTPAP